MKWNIGGAVVWDAKREATVCHAVLVLAVVLWGSGCSQHAGPGARTLFDGEGCSFLPEQQPPPWLTERPKTDDAIGVGSADRMPDSTAQIQMAEQTARAALAAEIEVSVKEVTDIFMEERYGSSKSEMSREARTEISSQARQVIDQTLSGSQISARYLDRRNCVTYVLARMPKNAVDEAKKKLAEQLRRQFKLKQLMLFDRSNGEGSTATIIRDRLQKLFIKNKLLVSDVGQGICVDDPGKPQCTDTIYAGYTVVRDERITAGEKERRIYRLTGLVRYRVRQIASFDVVCQGTGNVGQDYLIDEQAAESCFNRARPTIIQGMEGAE